MDPTLQIVEGYNQGRPIALIIAEVECGKYLRSDLVPQAKAALIELRANGLSVTISSAWRTMDEQTRLYEGWKEGVPGFNPADQPGYSKHQNGTAWDLHFQSGDAREAASAILVGFGFTRPVQREPWHFLGAPIPSTPVPYPIEPPTV